MIPTNEFKKGVKVEINNEPYIIVDFQHVKPGKGNAFTRTKFKNLLSGSTLERTLKSGEVLPEANVSLMDYDFLYKEAKHYVFMNTQTYEQLEINDDWIEAKSPFLKDNMRVRILFHKDTPFDIELPNFVELSVIYCEPGVKGDSATGSTKPAQMGNELTVQVPLHIKIGDTLKIDTRTNKYVEKVGNK